MGVGASHPPNEKDKQTSLGVQHDERGRVVYWGQVAGGLRHGLGVMHKGPVMYSGPFHLNRPDTRQAAVMGFRVNKWTGESIYGSGAKGFMGGLHRLGSSCVSVATNAVGQLIRKMGPMIFTDNPLETRALLHGVGLVETKSAWTREWIQGVFVNNVPQGTVKVMRETANKPGLLLASVRLTKTGEPEYARVMNEYTKTIYVGHVTRDLDPEGNGIAWYRDTNQVLLGSWKDGKLHGRVLLMNIKGREVTVAKYHYGTMVESEDRLLPLKAESPGHVVESRGGDEAYVSSLWEADRWGEVEVFMIRVKDELEDLRREPRPDLSTHLPTRSLGDVENGWGVLLGPDLVIYEGYFKNGRHHGHGECMYPPTNDGIGEEMETFRGLSNDGEWASGKWTLGHWSLEGSFVGTRIPSGWCLLTYPNGATTTAYFTTHGRMDTGNVKTTVLDHTGERAFCGMVYRPVDLFQVPTPKFGVEKRADGSVYRGDFDDQGRRHGDNGLLFFSDGRVYDGPFRGDCPDSSGLVGETGLAIVLHTMQDVLTRAAFKEGEMHGKGYQCSVKTGRCTDIYEVTWKDGQVVGKNARGRMHGSEFREALEMMKIKIKGAGSPPFEIKFKEHGALTRPASKSKPPAPTPAPAPAPAPAHVPAPETDTKMTAPEAQAGRSMPNGDDFLLDEGFELVGKRGKVIKTKDPAAPLIDVTLWATLEPGWKSVYISITENGTMPSSKIISKYTVTYWSPGHSEDLVTISDTRPNLILRHLKNGQQIFFTIGAEVIDTKTWLRDTISCNRIFKVTPPGSVKSMPHGYPDQPFLRPLDENNMLLPEDEGGLWHFNIYLRGYEIHSTLKPNKPYIFGARTVSLDGAVGVCFRIHYQLWGLVKDVTLWVWKRDDTEEVARHTTRPLTMACRENPIVVGGLLNFQEYHVTFRLRFERHGEVVYYPDEDSPAILLTATPAPRPTTHPDDSSTIDTDSVTDTDTTRSPSTLTTPPTSPPSSLLLMSTILSPGSPSSLETESSIDHDDTETDVDALVFCYLTDIWVRYSSRTNHENQI